MTERAGIRVDPPLPVSYPGRSEARKGHPSRAGVGSPSKWLSWSWLFPSSFTTGPR